MANLNHKAPTVGVRVANGLPERSVASATLASAPYLPPAAMQGHVMPTFPHTLIGLGPFADLGCKIIFTKTAVSVIHPDGHSNLEGWRELEGPRLWRFPLTATKPSLPVTALHETCEELGPRGSAADFFNPALSTLIERSPGPSGPPPVSPATSHSILATGQRPGHLHPSHGILATNVYYLSGAAQAMALAARASGTPFDPPSLDLPSIGALVGFYHACLGFPVKQT
jgi:hypothetical protein